MGKTLWPGGMDRGLRLALECDRRGGAQIGGRLHARQWGHDGHSGEKQVRPGGRADESLSARWPPGGNDAVWEVPVNETIGKISDIRMSNNRLWMRLLEIALDSEPELTKDLLRQINENDGKISALLAELAP